MTAYNGRLKPKRVFGVPVYALLLLMIALPMSILGLLVDVALLSALLFSLSVVCLLLAIFFFVLGDDAPFFHVFILAKKENNNVTCETWTRF